MELEKSSCVNRSLACYGMHTCTSAGTVAAAQRVAHQYPGLHSLSCTVTRENRKKKMFTSFCQPTDIARPASIHTLLLAMLSQQSIALQLGSLGIPFDMLDTKACKRVLHAMAKWPCARHASSICLVCVLMQQGDCCSAFDWTGLFDLDQNQSIMIMLCRHF